MGLLAHVDAGKTSITEQFLYHTGSIRERGSVDKGTAHTDYMGIERSRGISVRAAVTSLRLGDTQINVIDTPGHMDFSGEVERALSVIDSAVMVVSAVEGVQANTEVLWDALQRRGIPVIFFVNKIDRAGADVASVIAEIRLRLTKDLCVLNLPQPGEVRTAPVPFDEIAQCVAERDDALLQRYLEESLTQQDTEQAFRDMCRRAQIFPLLCGSAACDVGIDELLAAIAEYCPALVRQEQAAHEPAAGVVFKVEHDAAMGRIAHVRLYSGTLKNRDSIAFANCEPLKISQIRKFFGEKYEDVGVLEAGDIGALCGLSQARPGDVFGPEELVPKPVRWVEPLLRVSVQASAPQEYPALTRALGILSEEDPLLDFYPAQGTEEAYLRLTGAIQTEVLHEQLSERFGLQARFGAPSVVFKETPASVGEGFDAYTMPKPCWAVLRFLIEPGKRGSGLAYESQVPPKKLPYRYQHHVELAVGRALKQGLYGWEVTDLHVTLVDGGYHEVHTHPLDFFVATPLALADGLSRTGTTLLEPMLEFRISAPDSYSGRIIGELVAMHAEFDSPSVQEGRFLVTGTYPVAPSLEFPVRLAAITGGQGMLSTRFGGYRACKADVKAECARRGVDPRERSKFILWARGALGEFGGV